MKIIYAIILVALISGCSNMDKQQAMADCKFDAVKAKQSESDQSDYLRTCMLSKGYSQNSLKGCSDVYTILSDCWDYTWRVFF